MIIQPLEVRVGPDRRTDYREVYFVHAKALGLVKIGIANSAVKRLRALATQSPAQLELLGVIQTDRRGVLEQMLHGRFQHLRSHGEWFRLEPDLEAYISESAAAPKSPRRPSMLEKRLLNQRRRAARAISINRAREKNGLPPLAFKAQQRSLTPSPT